MSRLGMNRRVMRGQVKRTDLREVDNKFKINKHGHAVAKIPCPVNCGGQKILVRHTATKGKCTKCGVIAVIPK